MNFVLHKMAVKQVLIGVLRFVSLSNIIPPILSILRRLVLTLSLRMSGYRCQADPQRIHDEHSVTGTEFSRNVHYNHFTVLRIYSFIRHLSYTYNFSNKGRRQIKRLKKILPISFIILPSIIHNPRTGSVV
jgi:hypothetical protein